MNNTIEDIPLKKAKVEPFDLSEGDREIMKEVNEKFFSMDEIGAEELSELFKGVSYRILYSEYHLLTALIYSASLASNKEENEDEYRLLIAIRNTLFNLFSVVAVNDFEAAEEVSVEFLRETLKWIKNNDPNVTRELLCKHSYLVLTALIGTTDNFKDICHQSSPFAVSIAFNNVEMSIENRVLKYNEMKALVEDPNSTYSDLNKVFADWIVLFFASKKRT